MNYRQIKAIEVANKCEQCLHSRPIVSENGIHYGCCLSAKKAVECMCGFKDYQARKPMVNDGKT